MMLASPFVHSATFSPKMSSSTPEDPLSFRPARDVETFNSLLPPPIEFVEGSSSGALAVPEGKYQPINVSPQPSTKDRLDGSPIQHKTSIPLTPTAPPAPTSPTTPSSAKSAAVPLTPTVGVDLSWPEIFDHATGLYNTGNTCFLNSALQCLLHTPPLLRVVIAHGKDKCRVGDKFCMVCAFRQVAVQAHKSSSPFSPHPVSSRLLTIAKHMRRGRQEDSHEFLRYAIDAMQKSCLHGVPQKLEAKLGESTWVHKIFGGKLRSRVSCQGCGHNSDTFDRILDLSLDIIRSDSLKEALKSFISPDYLKGSDKYKCEKCKRHVNAEKRFTIHEAPAVLTVHLKRFSPLGRKIGHHVTYDDTLHLQPYMSKEQFGPTYSLYGVICHAGGGPNSGHYYAFVKSRTGRWYEMNDEMVSPIGGPPVNKKTAYMLFYIRNKGQGLQALVKSGGGGGAVNGMNGVHKEKDAGGERMGLVAGMKKRREREDDGDGGSGEREEEDVGEKVTPPRPTSTPAFIGPLLPSPMDESIGRSPTKKAKVHHGDVVNANAGKKSDPQAEKIKQKIQAAQEAKAKKALAALGGYESSSTADGEEEKDDDEEGKDVTMNADKKPKLNGKGKVRAIVESDDEESGGEGENGNERKSSPPATSSLPPSPSKHVSSSPISTTNFYGSSSTSKRNPTSPRVNGRLPQEGTHNLHLRFDDDSSDNDATRTDRVGHGDHHSKKHKKLEGTKMRMSMESSQGLSRKKAYVNNPFERVGSENSAASRGAGGNGSAGGRMNTYGKRRPGRARGL